MPVYSELRFVIVCLNMKNSDQLGEPDNMSHIAESTCHTRGSETPLKTVAEPCTCEATSKAMVGADMVKDARAAFCESVCMQGLKPILDRQSWVLRRVLWMLVVVSALGFTFYEIHIQLSTYLSTPITVRVDVERSKDMAFPVVTLCNNDAITTSFVQSVNAVKEVKAAVPLFYSEQTWKMDFSHFDINHSQYQSIGWGKFFENGAHSLKTSLLEAGCQSEMCWNGVRWLGC